jgi:Wadjet anti plasmid transformation system JetA-like protein
MTQDAAPPPSDITAAFENELLSYGKTRIDRAGLWSMWNRADPAWAGQWASRARLADALTTLAAAGTIELPATGGRSWDTALPPLPGWVAVPANRNPGALLLDPATEPWAPSMDWATEWIRVARPPQAARLAAVQINRWLLSTVGRTPPRVAREERSLHIFGDEKKLAILAAGAMFGPGNLTLDDLACDAPLGSLRIARLTDHGPVLVLENKSTFDSAWRALKADERPRYAAVVFGSGDAAPTLADDLAHLGQTLGITATRFDYAGDIDIAGIEAAALFARAATAKGLPAVMALTLWDAVGQAPPTGEDITGDASQRPAALRHAAALGLPDSVARRLNEGVRVPQERIDRTALSDTAWWAPQHERDSVG